MDLLANWGIVVTKDDDKVDILWYYNIPTAVVPQLVAKLSASLDSLIYKGPENEIISVFFEVSEPITELFIIILADNHFFICTNPLITSKMLREAEIPPDVSQLLTGMLVAQATIFYSSLWPVVQTEIKRKIDNIFQEGLKQTGQNITAVGNGSISLSELLLPDLIFLHSFVRKELITILHPKKRKSWIYCTGKLGNPVHFHFPVKVEYPKLHLVIAIYKFVSKLIDILPKSLIIGQDSLMSINFLFGEDNTIITNNLNLLETTTVLDAIEKLPDDIRLDVIPSISNYYYSRAIDIITNDLRSISYIKVASGLENGSGALADLLIQQQTYQKSEEKKAIINLILLEAEEELNNFLKDSAPAASATQLKLVLLGDGAVGKTTSKHVFMGNPYRLHYQATLGVDFSSLDIKIERHKFQAQIWDLAGQQKYKQIRATFYKGTSGALIMFDLSRPETMASIENWIEELYSHTSKSIPLIIFGNKKDLRNEGLPGVTDEEAVEFVEQLKHQVDPEDRVKISYLPGSAKTGENLKLAFHLITCRAAGGFFQSYVGRIAEVIKDNNNGTDK